MLLFIAGKLNHPRDPTLEEGDEENFEHPMIAVAKLLEAMEAEGNANERQKMSKLIMKQLTKV